MNTTRKLKWAGLGTGLLYFGLLIVGWMSETTDCWSGWAIMADLGSLCAAQEEFRGSDADRNGTKDYWRGDVAGLYTLAPAGPPLRYINLTTAQADRRPLSAPPGGSSAHYAYWYQTLGFRNERPSDRSRFAFLAFPEAPDSGSWMFIVSHEGEPYGKLMDSAGPPDYYPENPRSDGWLTRDQVRSVRWKREHALWWVQFWRAL